MAGRRRGWGEGSTYRRKDGRWVGHTRSTVTLLRLRADPQGSGRKRSKAIAERDAGLF